MFNFFIILIFSINVCVAGVPSKMGQFFTDVGVRYNATRPNYYNLQKGGYFHGGSFYARMPVKTTQLAHMQPPSWNMGCAGISWDTGGFSFISKEEFVNTLKAITTSAGAFAFKLGLQTITPQISGIMDYLNDARMLINQTSINSCDAGAAIVGGLASQIPAAKVQYCKMEGMNVGRFSDEVSSRACRVEEVQRDVEARAQSAGKKTLTDNFNLAYEVIQSSDELSKQDDEFKSFVMALTGTIIIENGKRKKVLPGALDEGLLDILLGGGESLKTYVCLDEKCLNIRKSKLVIPFEKSMVGQTTALIKALCDAIIDQVQLTSEVTERVEGFLSRSHIPIYNNMVANIAATGGLFPLKSQQYAEVLAIDLAAEFLNSVIRDMQDGLANLEENLIGDFGQKFKENVELLQTGINKRRVEVYKKAQVNSSMEIETNALRQHVVSSIDISGLL